MIFNRSVPLSYRETLECGAIRLLQTQAQGCQLRACVEKLHSRPSATNSTLPRPRVYLPPQQTWTPADQQTAVQSEFKAIDGA